MVDLADLSGGGDEGADVLEELGPLAAGQDEHRAPRFVVDGDVGDGAVVVVARRFDLAADRGFLRQARRSEQQCKQNRNPCVLSHGP